MRAVVQRTNYAYVTSEGTESGRTGPGLMVLLGVSRDDTEEDARYMADKICHLRIFEDEGGKMKPRSRQMFSMKHLSPWCGRWEFTRKQVCSARKWSLHWQTMDRSRF